MLARVSGDRTDAGLFRIPAEQRSLGAVVELLLVVRSGSQFQRDRRRCFGYERDSPAQRHRTIGGPRRRRPTDACRRQVACRQQRPRSRSVKTRTPSSGSLGIDVVKSTGCERGRRVAIIRPASAQLSISAGVSSAPSDGLSRRARSAASAGEGRERLAASASDHKDPAQTLDSVLTGTHIDAGRQTPSSGRVSSALACRSRHRGPGPGIRAAG
jgi:hypothetical protein